MIGHFGIEKTYKLLVRKYHCQTLYHDVQDNVKECNICLVFKAIYHKPYGDLQLLPVLTHQCKNLLMDFVTSLLISIDGKKDSYNSILVIVYWLTKMIHYQPVKITLDVPGLAEVIINVVIYHHGLVGLIVTNKSSFFTLKFRSLLYYFFGIKQKLFTTFYP